MTGERQTFGKSERLCSTKLISQIFVAGNIFYSHHFKVLWIISPVVIPSAAQVAFSIPKKVLKLAVTRNLIKRRFREAYRRNKQKLYDVLRAKDKQLAFIVIYRQNSVPQFRTMERYVVELIEALCSIIENGEEKC